MTRNLYSIAMFAVRHTAEKGTIFSIGTGWVRAVSKEEALGSAYKRALCDYPADDGWYRHMVVASQIIEETPTGPAAPAA